MDTMKSQCRFVINLEEIIQNFAWKKYQNSLGVGKRLFQKKEKHDFDIQWTFLDFKHVTSISSTNATGVDGPVDLHSPRNDHIKSRTAKAQELSTFSYKSAFQDLDCPVILCTEYFENSTKTKDSFLFSAHEKLKSTMTVKLFQSYSLGAETNIELNISGEPTASKCLTVTNPIRQDFEDIHSFDVETPVIVEPSKKAEAVVSVFEKEVVSTFEITTTVSMAIGCVPVIIRRRSDNKPVYSCFISSFNDVFRKHVGSNLMLVNAGKGKYNLVITSRGSCTSTAWSDPELIVKAEAIRPEHQISASDSLFA